MNPMTNIKNVLKLSEKELKTSSKSSWHDMYKGSAWIFVGGLPYELSEGDVLCVFSQYGEIVNINLVRDKFTGRQKGFCFICFEDQRSTILSVDNLNGIKILGRTIRVDHVADYKAPKENEKLDEETKRLQAEGCAPKLQIPQENIKRESRNSGNQLNDTRFRERMPISDGEKAGSESKKIKVKKEKKAKKEKKSKKSKKEKKAKKKRKRHSSTSSNDTDSDRNEKKSRS